MGSSPGIEAAKKRLHHNVLAIALANKLARIAWAVLKRSAPSNVSGRTRQRPDRFECRAVLGPVKAWPGRAEARGQRSATANLAGPCARRLRMPAGRDEGTALRHEQRNCAR